MTCFDFLKINFNILLKKKIKRQNCCENVFCRDRNKVNKVHRWRGKSKAVTSSSMLLLFSHTHTHTIKQDPELRCFFFVCFSLPIK